MAYSALNLRRYGDGNGPAARHQEGPGIWTYSSTDAMTTVRAAGYISDAHNQGMKVGDWVYVTTVNGSGVPQTAYLTMVLAITSGAADLADGTAITLTNT